MKFFLAISFTTLFSYLFHTNEVNELKVAVKKSYKEKKYLEAIKIYTLLEKKYHIKEPSVIYDHANACYRSLQLKQAYKYYQIIADGEDSILSSQALNQMGIICCRIQKLKEGKELFMQSLRKNSSNRHAVLNLEWALTLKDVPTQKEKHDKQKVQQQKQSSDSNHADYKADPSGSEEDKEALRSSSHTNKYMDMNKARLLLESMKNSEKQYIQQLPVNTTTKPNEPAW